jgi:hypothetical protein
VSSRNFLDLVNPSERTKKNEEKTRKEREKEMGMK